MAERLSVGGASCLLTREGGLVYVSELGGSGSGDELLALFRRLRELAMQEPICFNVVPGSSEEQLCRVYEAFGAVKKMTVFQLDLREAD